MFGETFNRTTARSVGSVALAVGLMIGSVPLAAAAMPAGNVAPVAQPASVVMAAELSIDLPSRVRTTDNLNLRTGPSTSYSVLVNIPKGTSVPVLGRASNGWYKVSYDGRTGYVSDYYVVAATVRTLDSLNMRTGTSTSYRILVTIPKGEHCAGLCPRLQWLVSGQLWGIHRLGQWHLCHHVSEAALGSAVQRAEPDFPGGADL